jgi:hypothetical protein
MIAATFPMNSGKCLSMLLSAPSLAELNRACGYISIVAHGAGEAFAEDIAGVLGATNHKIEIVSDDMRGHMSALRQRSFDGAPHATYFLLLDDDIVLKPGYAEAVREAAEYMDANLACGAVLLAGSLGGAPFGKRITPFRGRHVATAHGILVRNFKTPLFIDALHCVGGGEEAVLAAKINQLGSYIAKRFFAPARHIHGGDYVLSPGNPDVIHDLTLAQHGNFAVAARLLGVKNVFGKPVFNRAFNFKPDAAAAALAAKWKSK